MPPVSSSLADLQARLPELMLRDQRRLERRLDGARRVRSPEARRSITEEVSAEIAKAEVIQPTPPPGRSTSRICCNTYMAMLMMSSHFTTRPNDGKPIPPPVGAGESFESFQYGLL